MKVVFGCLMAACLLGISCGPHPGVKEKHETKKNRYQEVIIILSPYIDNYEYEMLPPVEVEMEISRHAFLTATEDLLVKLIKAAQKVGANALTNLDIGSYDMLAYLPHESVVGRKHRIYARGTPLVLHGFEGLPAPATIVKDRPYIRLQCNEYPPSRNVFILLSPFLEQTDHEEIGPISIRMPGEEKASPNRTEELLRGLTQEAALRGANAITNLDIGALFLVGYMYDEAERRSTHEAYARALAIKTLPRKD